MCSNIAIAKMSVFAGQHISVKNKPVPEFYAHSYTNLSLKNAENLEMLSRHVFC